MGISFAYAGQYDIENAGQSTLLSIARTCAAPPGSQHKNAGFQALEVYTEKGGVEGGPDDGNSHAL
jgi:hypothetical protein